MSNTILATDIPRTLASLNPSEIFSITSEETFYMKIPDIYVGREKELINCVDLKTGRPAFVEISALVARHNEVSIKRN